MRPDRAKAHIRPLVNQLTRAVIKDELVRKRLIVANANLQYCFSRKVKSTPHIMDADGTLAQRRFPVDELYRGNAYYGISNAIRNFSGFDAPIKACVEHGVYFGDYVNSLEADSSGLPAVITFSDMRKTHLAAKTTKPIYQIGPYIRYAQPYLDHFSAEELRKRLGRVLLVFPTHSIDAISSHFNVDSFMRKVGRLAKSHDFDHVLVCLYWRDYELGRHVPYRELGYEVVTAGRREDPDFLRRLRSFIELSSHTVSNSVGTHVGYSVALGRGHTILPQTVVHKGLTRAHLSHELAGVDLDTREFERTEVLDAFSKYEEIITAHQASVIDKYWGLNHLRSQEELREILEACENAFGN